MKSELASSAFAPPPFAPRLSGLVQQFAASNPARTSPLQSVRSTLGVNAATSAERIATFAFLLSAVVALADDVPWKQQDGQFATFSTPPAMAKDTNNRSDDSITDAYESHDIYLSFDSPVRVIPPTFQKQFDRTVETWTAQRRKDWRKSTYVDNGGAIHGVDHDPKVTSSRLPYYLYLGFQVGESGTFAIHISFSSLKCLDDVERILKSIKFKTK
ncbi:MAG: hypothetical protein ABI680_11170 [Chthoniobacteraceae bacterium]